MWSEEDFMHTVENFITVDVIKQIYKASYDEKRVRSLETFKEKHTRN